MEDLWSERQLGGPNLDQVRISLRKIPRLELTQDHTMLLRASDEALRMADRLHHESEIGRTHTHIKLVPFGAAQQAMYRTMQGVGDCATQRKLGSALLGYLHPWSRSWLCLSLSFPVARLLLRLCDDCYLCYYFLSPAICATLSIGVSEL